jgi:hypothetical protein
MSLIKYLPECNASWPIKVKISYSIQSFKLKGKWENRCIDLRTLSRVSISQRRRESRIVAAVYHKKMKLQENI